MKTSDMRGYPLSTYATLRIGLLHDLAEASRAVGEREARLHVPARFLACALAQLAVGDETIDRAGECNRILRRDEPAGRTVLDCGGDRAHTRGDDRPPRCHRLEDHVRQTVAISGPVAHRRCDNDV